jgi:hypothetical protein
MCKSAVCSHISVVNTSVLSLGKLSTTAFPAKNPRPRGLYATVPIPSSLRKETGKDQRTGDGPALFSIF